MSKYWANKVILITGAGSGIGKSLASLFAAQNAKLVLTDVNAANLDETVRALGKAVVISKAADVRSVEDWQSLANEIEHDPGHLDVLINNAGMAPFGYFDETSKELFDKVMDVNFNGVVHGCRIMLPLLERARRGLIVNVASIFGLIAVPTCSSYHASKFAVRGFTEALKQDLMFQKKNVDVVCVMPGGIKTNIANFAETDRVDGRDFAQHFSSVALTSPDKAAQVIEKGMRKNTFRILIGPDAKLVDWLYKLLPTDYYRISNPLLGIKKIL